MEGIVFEIAAGLILPARQIFASRAEDFKRFSGILGAQRISRLCLPPHTPSLQ